MERAKDFSLPCDRVEQQEKVEFLYATPEFYKFILKIESVYQELLKEKNVTLFGVGLVGDIGHVLEYFMVDPGFSCTLSSLLRFFSPSMACSLLIFLNCSTIESMLNASSAQPVRFPLPNENCSLPRIVCEFPDTGYLVKELTLRPKRAGVKSGDVTQLVLPFQDLLNLQKADKREGHQHTRTCSRAQVHVGKYQHESHVLERDVYTISVLHRH